MNEETCSEEIPNSVLEEYKQSLNEVSQLIGTSQHNISDQETGEVFARLSKAAGEIQHLLEDGVDIKNLLTPLQSGLHLIRDILLKNKADPVQSLDIGVRTVHPVALSSKERRGLKRHASGLEELLSGISKKKELRLSTSLTKPGLHEGPSTCFTTHADVGHFPSCECLEPQLREEENGDLKYTLRCPTAGLFRCKFTSLMFKMETAGEVEYHSVPWADKLENHDREPAGPLYNISCFPGTPVQIHLPHCEVISDGKLGHLRVAHITGDGLKIITPKDITESHVVIDVTGLSLFGLLTFFTDYLLGRNIRAQVLNFLQRSSEPVKVQVLLLSSNADIMKVKKKRGQMIHPCQEIYIETNPYCEINTRKDYSLFTDPPGLDVIPNTAKYVECSQNFPPAFTVHCRRKKELKLILKDKTRELWSSLVIIEEKDTPDGRQHVLEPSVSKHFFQKHKGALETRLPKVLESILNQLVQREVLNTIERDVIQSKKPDHKRNECLLNILDKKGSRAQEIFCQVLKTEDCFLVEDLEKKC
ncbi:uncharacterized protein LOC105891702 [Clupea harengus]|uniref:Uncharacterized protein LOC105891702 n=1 Tax=Clupea harengus TaxID=7950 RepID=A0A6P8GPR2_CLUHA|nr:uncharacterized protein LOC105891702 [Clupea harengus]XP_031440744.1 uncharacterized protein LOC105891702 [Clupea harengus]XP_042566346.1 uncharacterized protein LOC105891702 [Clupea harengus]